MANLPHVSLYLTQKLTKLLTFKVFFQRLELLSYSTPSIGAEYYNDFVCMFGLEFPLQFEFNKNHYSDIP